MSAKKAKKFLSIILILAGIICWIAYALFSPDAPVDFIWIVCIFTGAILIITGIGIEHGWEFLRNTFSPPPSSVDD